MRGNERSRAHDGTARSARQNAIRRRGRVLECAISPAADDQQRTTCRGSVPFPEDPWRPA